MVVEEEMKFNCEEKIYEKGCHPGIRFVEEVALDESNYKVQTRPRRKSIIK